MSFSISEIEKKNLCDDLRDILPNAATIYAVQKGKYPQWGYVSYRLYVVYDNKLHEITYRLGRLLNAPRDVQFQAMKVGILYNGDVLPKEIRRLHEYIHPEEYKRYGYFELIYL